MYVEAILISAYRKIKFNSPLVANIPPIKVRKLFQSEAPFQVRWEEESTPRAKVGWTLANT